MVGARGANAERLTNLDASLATQTLMNQVIDLVDDDAMCSSLQGPTCAALADEKRRARDIVGKEDETVLKATRSKKSRISLVRLDGIDDLVNYFKKHAAAELSKLVLTKESTASEASSRENARGRKSATSGLTDVSGKDASESDEDDDDTDFNSHAASTSGSTGGPFDGSVKSVPGLLRRGAVFYNSRSTAVSLYWVDFEGKEIHYVDVHPFHQGIVKTFQLHVWVVRDMISSRFIAQYTVGDEGTSTESFTIPTSRIT